jgi:glycosyltransferase involved in cell wall biosynthesis
MCTLAAIPACRLLGIPLVNGTIRQAYVPGYRGGLMRLGFPWSDRIIANSRAGLRAFGVSPGKGRVVYNGFDPVRLPLCKRTTERADGVFTVVMAARMHSDKDHSTFVEAARILGQSDPEWRFHAVGGGPMRAEILARGRDLIARESLRLSGPCREALPLVREADVGVLLSDPRFHQEGCSNAIMEYMACGLPVVCSDSGGNSELVIEGETGFLVPAGDVGALVERLRWLRASPDLCRRLGENGRKRIAEGFSVEAMVQGTIAAYEEVIGGRG